MLSVYFPACGWGVVPSMVLVLSVYFPACEWGVGAKCLFVILWVGCSAKCVVSHHVDGVLVLSVYLPSCGWGVVPSLVLVLSVFICHLVGGV